jgi:hypothetical protein
MDKPILFYDVRVQTSRVTGGTLYLPAIVEREEAVPLDTIIERAIDRGLIAGIKPSAAKQIADAIAQQMYEEFKAGRGVKFANYFYARLYLDGKSDASGKLTSANGINVRFANGTGFKLTMDMFTFSNVNGGDIPGTDFLISEADGAERGILIPEANVILNGVNLWKDGDAGTKISFYAVDAETGEIDEEPTAVVTNFATKGPNALKFAWVAALERGKSYMAVPARSADGERWFTGTGRTATVKED